MAASPPMSKTTRNPAPPPADDNPVSRFEASLKELEDIVTRMERGDLPLEESLQLFERGINLTRGCRQALDTAELRVRSLMDQNDTQAASAANPPSD